jgi:hypothetical protein
MGEEMKNNVGLITLPNVKIYYVSAVVKIV